MNTLSTFARGEANRDKETMVFDWLKAARIIKERGAKTASAGLRGDWEWTGGQILDGGAPVKKEETYTYLASTWATPELDVDGQIIDCYVMQSETPKGSWDAGTYWPSEALEVLNKA